MKDKLPKIENCPCCGSEAAAYRTGTWGSIRCSGSDCSLKMEHSQGVEYVIEKWNRRVKESGVNG